MATNTSVNLSDLIPEIIAQEVELTSQENGFRRYRDFVVVKEDLTKRPGDTLQIPKVGRLRRAQNLNEASTLEGSGSQLVVSSIPLTPTERGDELQITEYSSITTQVELETLIVELIADQSAREENLTIRDEMNTAGQTRFAGGVLSGAAVTATLSSDDIDIVVDTLEASQAKKFDDSFVAFIHPYAKGGLRQNIATTDQYRDTVPGLYAGEIGMYNRTRFIETAFQPVDNFSTGSVVVTGATGTFDESLMVFTDDQNLEPGDYVLTFTSATLYNITDPGGNTLVTGADRGVSQDYDFTDLEGLVTTLFTIPPACFGGVFIATDTVTITVQQNLITFVLAQRSTALGILKRATMLGAREFDYGRRLGVAWNGFWDIEILNDSYIWRIESKR